MRAKEVMELYGITRSTLWRWVKLGRIGFEIKPSGRYDYLKKVEMSGCEIKKQNIIYARVSTTGQKENLNRQVERLKLFASSKGIIIDEVYQEIASALNYNRRNYRKLVKGIIDGKIGIVFAEYKDRILRIGFEDFESLCREYGVKLIISDLSEDKADTDKNKEIINDLISIIHHFSSKIYSLRRNKKQIESLITEC